MGRTAAGRQPHEWLAGLEGELSGLVKRASGHVGYDIRDLDTGDEVTYDARRIFPAASVIKVPALVAALRVAESGDLDLDRSVRVPPEARVGGSGVLKELRVETLSVRDLLTLMTVLSDNTATNVCLDVIGFDTVTDCARRGGCLDTRCQRKMMDVEARARGLTNDTTAADMTEFLHRLIEGDLLPPESTAYAMDVLRGQQSRWALARRLPFDVDLAHKTGELEGLRHDVGVLAEGGRRAAIAILCEGFFDPSMPDNFVGGEASDLLADMGEAIHAAMTSGSYERSRA